jgi:quercetin dioxygenase-like cupin family protein
MTMSRKTLKLMLVGFFVTCALGAIALKVAWATPPTGLTRTLLMGPVVFGNIDVQVQTDDYNAQLQTEGASDVYFMEITIAPGGDTGWHSHPGIVIATVKSGTATEYDGDDPDAPPIIHEAGTGFVEQPGHVHLVRNEGETDLEFVVLFLVPHGSPTRTDEPAPVDPD